MLFRVCYTVFWRISHIQADVFCILQIFFYCGSVTLWMMGYGCCGFFLGHSLVVIFNRAIRNRTSAGLIGFLGSWI